MPQPDHGSLLQVVNPRSGCPINLAAELLGDRWSLLVLRDLAFGGPRHYRDLLAGSAEGIASNILSTRLSKLVAAGMLARRPDPTHRQRFDFCLTEPAIEFLPALVTISMWAATWLPADPAMSTIARALHDGGPELLARFMDELRAEHLHGRAAAATSLRHTFAGSPGS
jgi:DNA-binding HxlR family transcriptional regulator